MSVNWYMFIIRGFGIRLIESKWIFRFMFRYRWAYNNFLLWWWYNHTISHSINVVMSLLMLRVVFWFDKYSELILLVWLDYDNG